MISLSRSNVYSNSSTAGIADSPKPMWSGATRWKRSASAAISSRNMNELVGNPCSSTSVGRDGSPASR